MTLQPRSCCLLFVAVLAAVASAGQAGSRPGAPKKVSAEEIGRLIDQLGSKDFKTRDKATRRLKELDEALPALRQALKSPAGEETRRRVEGVIAVIEARLAEVFIREAVARVNEEGLDLFIDRMVLQKGYATEARWKAAVELTRALLERARKAGATPPNVLEQDFLKLPVITALDRQGFLRPSRVLVDGSRDQINAFHGNLLFSTNSLEGINSTDRSILFVNGDIKSLNSTTNSIIICNGTIKNMNYTNNCIIFCNGVIAGMNVARNSALFVRGKLGPMGHVQNNIVEAAEFAGCALSEGNTYLNRTKMPARGKGDQARQADPSSLNLFRYFDFGRAGMTFTMVDGDARVDRVAEDKPFAKAGLQKGDLVLAVNRGKFLSQDVFHRLVRRRVAAGEALLKVQRGDRVLELTVPLAP
jgi:hypothetical protein